MSREERERRLRALTNPSSSKRMRDEVSESATATEDLFGEADAATAEDDDDADRRDTMDLPKPAAYKMPKRAPPSPDTRPRAPMKKAAVDIFMPVKRKKVA